MFDFEYPLIEKVSEYGIVGSALALVYMSMKIVLKKFGNGKGIISAPPVVDLTPTLKSAIYDTKAHSEQTTNNAEVLNNLSGQISDLHKWHETDSTGHQDWKGGRILEAQRESIELQKINNSLLRELISEIKAKGKI